MSKTIALTALRFAMWRLRLSGRLSRPDHQELRGWICDDPSLPGTPESFNDLLSSAIMAEAVRAGVAKEGPEGPIIDGLLVLIQLIIDNWETIAKIIIWLIGLFAMASVKYEGEIPMIVTTAPASEERLRKSLLSQAA